MAVLRCIVIVFFVFKNKSKRTDIRKKIFKKKKKKRRREEEQQKTSKQREKVVREIKKGRNAAKQNHQCRKRATISFSVMKI
jgi:hypothetical protein